MPSQTIASLDENSPIRIYPHDRQTTTVLAIGPGITFKADEDVDSPLAGTPIPPNSSRTFTGHAIVEGNGTVLISTEETTP